ncbi:MAG: hypothetical protein QXV17_10030 [Candidatus Micrarchaeaceae archaeon]
MTDAEFVVFATVVYVTVIVSVDNVFGYINVAIPPVENCNAVFPSVTVVDDMSTYLLFYTNCIEYASFCLTNVG